MRRHILAGLAGCCVLSLYTASAQDAPPAGGEHEAPPYIVIEDFASTPLDSLPRDWRWRGKDDDKPKLYAVREANGRRYLAAQDTGHSVVLMKRFHWDPRQYPIMTWCWRADALPPGGDERYTETNDSAAGVHVIFRATGLASHDRSNTCGARPWPRVPSLAAKALPALGLSCSKVGRRSWDNGSKSGSI